MIERLEFVEELGFDWVSVSEHHYSPRILTPSPIVSAAFLAAHLKKIKIALLGPIVPQSNPVRVAEEIAMLDTMAQGRLVVGLLRGTSNESLTYDLNPAEARERTDEGMELVLKAWTEPQPFGWQGRHFRYRTISIWPRPLQQPHPPTFALGTSRESCDFAAVHAEAASSAETDWDEIVGLYDVLLRADPSPVIELNRAAAVAMRDGPEAGLRLMGELLARGELTDYPLLHSARGELFRKAGRTTDAVDAYRRALSLSRQDPQRRFLEQRIHQLSP